MQTGWEEESSTIIQHKVFFSSCFQAIRLTYTIERALDAAAAAAQLMIAGLLLLLLFLLFCTKKVIIREQPIFQLNLL
jgi:hypothetical protein